MMRRIFVWVMVCFLFSLNVSALETNLPSLSDVAFYVSYDQQGGDVTLESVAGEDGVLMSCYNSTQGEYVGQNPTGAGLGGTSDGFDVGQFGNSHNGSAGWMDIHMFDDDATMIKKVSLSYWFRRDPALTSEKNSGMSYLWEVRNGWSLDERQIDLENFPNNTNIDYPHLQVDYMDGADVIRIRYNAGGGEQLFNVGEMLEDGLWHNIIIIFKGYASSDPPYYQQGTDIDLYIDGSQITSGDPGFVTNGWGGLNFECFGFGTHYAKAGMGIADDFDDLAIWTRELTSTEITWIATGGEPIVEGGTVIVDDGFPDGDFNRNGFVNELDLNEYAQIWLGDCNVIDCGNADYDYDNTIGLIDYSPLAHNWQYDANTGPKMTIETVTGVATFVVDGIPTTAGVFSHNMPEDNNPVKGFSEIGTIIQDCGGLDIENIWDGMDPMVTDYGNIVLRLTRLTDPDTGDPNVLLVPWMTINAPTWWINDPANADELEVWDTGSGTTTYDPDNKRHGSLASTKWREEMALAIEDLMDFLYLNGWMKNIAGIKISDTGCGGENLWRHAHNNSKLAGYSQPTVEAFRDWLREKYNNDIGALEDAWNNTGINSFDNVQVPSKSDRQRYGQSYYRDFGYRTFRDPATEMDVIDFEVFWNELIVDTMDYFAGVIKRKTNNTKLVGGFYCYFYEWCGNPQDGHQALGKYNDAENLDFVWQTSSYQYRSYGWGADSPRGPAYTTQLHGKQWMLSNDTATMLAQSQFQPGGDFYDQYGYTETVEKNKRMFLRSAGFNICNNGQLQEFFTLWDGWYDSQDMLDAVEPVNNLYINSKNYDRSSNAEVLVVSDEVSCSYVTYSVGDQPLLQTVLRTPQLFLNQMGTQADHILLDDIPLLPEPTQYKLVVFLNCWHMTDAQRALVDTLKNNNRVLMFIYAPGYFNGETASVSAMEAVMGNGIPMVVGNETLQKPVMQVHDDTGYHSLGLAIRSKIGGNYFGKYENNCKRIYADVPNSQRVARDPTSTSHETMAIAEYGTWKAIYAVSPYMEPKVYREIADYAGVHIYNDNDDTFYVNSSYVCIHPNHSEYSQQSRTINFPQAVNIYDAETETLLQSNTTSYTANYYGGETKVYRYELVP